MSHITAEIADCGRAGDASPASERRRASARRGPARELSAAESAARRACEVALARAYASSRIRSTLPAAALVVMAALLMNVRGPSVIGVVWAASAFATLFFCRGLASALSRLRDEEIDVFLWRRKLAAAEFLHGAAWGAFAAAPLLAGDAGAAVSAALTLALVGAFNAMTTAAIRIAASAAVAPVSLAVLACLPAAGVWDAKPSFFLLVGAGLVSFASLAVRFHEATRESLFSRIEKNELIDALERAKANSDEARRRAEEASLAKSRFLATMSHELRTPLNAILGFSEVLKSELFGAHAVPAYKDYSADIHSSGQHLLNLINEILDLSRVEAGRYELREESVSLGAVVEDCRRLLAIRARERGVELDERIESGLPRIWADERAVRQIVLNLLANAIKFTPRGGRVTLKVGRTSAGGLYASIEDTGRGIPEEEIAVVMSSFGRGALALKNAEEGTGLGLPIVKGLIELHDGLFELKSKVGEGTQAIVTFPPARVTSVLPKPEPREERFAFIDRHRPAA